MTAVKPGLAARGCRILQIARAADYLAIWCDVGSRAGPGDLGFLPLLEVSVVSYAVRRASSPDLGPAARVLAAAFDAYPWTRWALPAEGYRERLEEVQRLYLGHAADHGTVLVDDGLRAVAAFLPPDAPEVDEAVAHRVAELHGQRWASLAALELPALPLHAWLLATVGVDPAHRGAGLGTAVVRAGLTIADEAGAPVGLETSDARNVRLYERLGFATVAVTQVPDGPVVHTMIRG